MKDGSTYRATTMPALLLEEDEKKPPFMDTGEDGTRARLAKVKNGVSFPIEITKGFDLPIVHL